MDAKIETRLQERMVVSFPALLSGFETPVEKWEQEATIYSLSKNGAGVVVNKKCQIGRLVLLNAPFPQHLRADNRLGEEYLVWGIVQHCAIFQDEVEDETYYLGIGFIGENPPQSFFENPLQDYFLTGVQENGFWKVAETGREFKARKYPRFSLSMEIYLGILDDHSNLANGEKVTTDNISIGGAAVYSNLDLNIGDCVKVIAAEVDFSALAIVRNIHPKQNQKLIRLEYISGRFPVQKIKDLKNIEAN